MTDNKITCSRVKWAYNYKFESVGNNVAELKSGESFNALLSDVKVILSEKIKESNGNEVIEQELAISVNENQILNLGQIARSHYILLLSRNDGKQFIWGNLTIPVEARLQNRTNSQIELKFYRTTTDFAEFGTVVIT